MIINNDCLKAMKEMEDNSVDSIVVDPPYGISFMNKKWDYELPSVEVFQEMLRVLKHGGHILCACGTRTQHRMAVNIEDAGFEIRDVISWIYGSGFPKSLNIGKAIDKAAGEHREVVGIREDFAKRANTKPSNREKMGKFADNDHNMGEITAPSTDEAKQWEGWGTALKPACEFWTLARKPLGEKTVAANVLKHGTGGINIDGCRIKPDYKLQGSDLSDIINTCQLNHSQLSANNVVKARFQDDTSNVIKMLYSVAENVDMNTLERVIGIVQEDTPLSTDTSCLEEMLVESINTSLSTSGSGKELTEKSQQDLKCTISTVSRMITELKISNLSVYQIIEVLLTKAKEQEGTLGAQGRFPSNLLHDGSEEVVELFPDTKGGKARTGVKGGSGFGYFDDEKTAKTIGTWHGGSGSAARFFYCAKSSKSDRTNNGSVENSHCTVKPTDLMRYLVRLITPPKGICLDPYMGSGSTGKACMLEGFNFIGIELDEDYCKIAKARIDSVQPPLL